MDLYQFLQALASLVLPALAGGWSVNLIGWLKAKLGTDGMTTWLIVGVVSALVSLVYLVAEGQITERSFSPEQIYATLIMVILASQIRYQELKRRESE